MKIVHRIYHNWKQDHVKYLSQFNINVELGYDKFDIEEGEVYQKIKATLESWGTTSSVGTFYTESEIDTSFTLVYDGTWSNGYPQPESGFGYIGTTYKKEAWCKSCGIGLVQQEPFRLKKEPVWSNKKLLDLNWIFDEIFVKKEVYESIFKDFSIGCNEVLLFKKETTIQNTVQLEIPTTNVEFNLQNQPYQICNVCGIKKYSPQLKGFFPKLSKQIIGIHCFKSLEYFGSGASAHKKVFMSQELRQAMLKQKIKSQFIPVES